MAFAPFEDGVVEFGTTALSPVQWDAMPQVARTYTTEKTPHTYLNTSVHTRVG